MPPHCQGFFWDVLPHKKGPKKAFTHKKGPKQTFGHWRPMGPSQVGTHTSDKGLYQKGLKKPDQKTEHKKTFGHWRPMGPSQMGTHTSDKGLFQKGLKKSLTKKRNTCPPTAKVFFGTSYHTKRVQKKPSHTKRVQNKPSDTGGPWGQVKWEPKRLTRDYSRKV